MPPISIKRKIIIKKKTKKMVIYDSENGKLYVPGKTDQVYIVTPEDIYQQGYNEGYQAGMKQAQEDCHNNNVSTN